MSQTNTPFLTAEWRHLLVFNYSIDPNLLRPLVPAGTELDFWNRTCYLSLVGFLFMNTRVLGVSVPFHKNFEKVNLRFYVKRKVEGTWRRGVVFVREIVPRWAIAFVGNSVYNENYEVLPMDHHLSASGDILRPDSSLSYRWKKRDKWNGFSATIIGAPRAIERDTEEAFVMEHYWGYSSSKNGGCLEYLMEHPSWRIWDVSECSLDCDISMVYGEQYLHVISEPPISAFAAEGSSISVGKGERVAVPVKPQ